MSSSMRNAIQRKNHKERAQPIERQKWGLLEKHKDYALRASDHREKRKRVKILKEKARDRNPDEFHFAMMSSRTKDGIRLGDRGNKALSHDVVLLLKTQDAGYLRTILQQTRLERRNLEKALKLTAGLRGQSVERLSSERQPSRKVYVDSAEEQLTYATQTAKVEVLRGLADGVQDDDKGHSLEPDASAAEQERRLERLKALITREEELILAERELELQRGKMSNNLGGVNKNGVKYKVRERKR